jgi:hypothetical protein
MDRAIIRACERYFQKLAAHLGRIVRRSDNGDAAGIEEALKHRGFFHL